MPKEIKCVTYNVRGLGDATKHREIMYHLKVNKYDIIFLQETHSSANSNKWWSSTWGSKIWCSHGQTNARGVAILFSKQIDIVVHNVISSADGRYLILYCTYNNIKLLLANIYAPNRDDPSFFEIVFREIERFTPDYRIIAGDFNLALNLGLDQRGTSSNNEKASEYVNNYLTANQICDVWRMLRPDCHGFTYRRLHPEPIFSRLDYFFTDENFLQFVDGIELSPAFKTDHSIVVMMVQFNAQNRGPGYWKLNTLLLQDTDYVERMNALIDIEWETSAHLKAYKDRWELLKLAVRGSSIQYSSRKQKSKRNVYESLQKKLKKLEGELIDKNPLFHDTKEQLQKVRHELEDHNKEKARGAQIRSKCNWALLAERPTKYFLNLEKQKFLKKTLYRVQNNEDKIITEPKQVLDEIKSYYKNLYISTERADLSYLDKLNMPSLPPEVRDELDANISIEELSVALKDLDNGKSPSTDGLPADFYKCFWPKLKDKLFEVVKEIIATGQMHLSA